MSDSQTTPVSEQAATPASRAQRRLVAVLLAVFFLFEAATLLIWHRIDHRPPRWDESHYLYIAEHSYQQLKAFHPIRALDLHDVTGTKPGFVPFVTALTYFVIGHSYEAAIIFVNMSSLLLLCYSLVTLSKLLFDRLLPGVVAALLFQSFPLTMMWLGYYQVDMPLTALAAFTVMLAMRADREGFQSRRDAALLAVALACGMATKHLYVVFVALPLVYFSARLLFQGGDFATRIRQRWPTLAGMTVGIAGGAAYHLLNIHILKEQLGRSVSYAAVGATSAPPPLWLIVKDQILAPHVGLYLGLFFLGSVCAVLAARRALVVYPLLWLIGGWVGIGAAASVPMSYYFLPAMPAFTLLSASLLAFDRFLPAPGGRREKLAAIAGICAACVLAVIFLQGFLGSANPVRLASAAPLLFRQQSEIRSNPLAEEAYWSSGVVNGSQSVLPYPSDWKTDEIVAALRDLVGKRGGSATGRLLTDYEWMTGELFRYKLLQANLTRQLDFTQPDFANLKDWAGAIKGADVLVIKSGRIFKDDFYGLPWAQKSQQAVDQLLAADGAILRQNGYAPYRTFALPDHTNATLWTSAESLLKQDLFKMMASAEMEPAKGGLISTAMFDIKGDARTVIYECPRVPPEATRVKWRGLTVTPATRLKFGIAVNPTCWGADKGDGVEFQIDLVEAGKAKLLFLRYIDPKQNATDRKWFDFELPLGVSGAHPVEIHLVTRPGPKGDTTYDQAGWSNPTLVH